MTVLVSACGGGSSAQGVVPEASFCSTQAFTAPTASPYVLPWNTGAGYTMFQGNCSTLGGHRDTFAYDFDLAMGDPVLASRAGTAIIVNDQSSGPHLHFQAFRDRSSFDKDNAIPITFSNALGQTAASGELIEGQLYEAGT